MRVDDTRATRYDVELLSTAAFNKVDLLFVIDNSISMTDKQRIFAEAVPVLLKRLKSPLCIDEAGNPTGEFSPCPAGAAEFRAIDDIHVGVITSSLGNHGGDVCTFNPQDQTPHTYNDRAELLPSVRTGLYSYDGSGFLVWDPRSQRPFPDPHPGLGTHETNEDVFITDFASQVQAAGESGCGYEASLEAWYRFLVDPEPVIEMTNSGGVVTRGPVNQLVLEQRRRFLRPDSLVAVVVLSDENDCSIVDESNQQGSLIARRIAMPRASSECATPGTDAFRCCRPCGSELEGCPPTATDPECQKAPFTGLEDSMNLRCFEQKRRFGFDLLYPVQRYVDALTRPMIEPRTRSTNGRSEVTNPLFALGEDGTVAPEGRAFLVGIIGVPWQDLADPTSFEGRELRYLDADELPYTAPNRWEVILGDPKSGVRPADPFMIESVDPRAGQNPITGDFIEPPHSGRSNAINGHEQDVLNHDDLQYACTFALAPHIPCTQQNQDGCDCNATEFGFSRPLCEYSDPLADGVQVRGKAYPGLRQLEVLKGLGHNAVVASICPKNTTAVGNPAADPSYGYNPAVGAMVSRLKPYFAPRCLPRPLPVNADNRVPCSVVEGQKPGPACFCDAARGRLELAPELSDAVRHELGRRGFCDGGKTPCSELCLCEVRQFESDELAICQSSPIDDESRSGFCYLDSTIANPDLLAACPSHEPQNLRFMGSPAPEPPWFQLIACAGQ